MLLSFPAFFAEFCRCMQSGGNKVGILTARSEDQKDTLLAQLADSGITPDFFIGKPNNLEVSDGTFKALVCQELGIDLLFDDFEASDPSMLGDFFAANYSTVPFTSWAYNPESKGGAQ